MTNTQNDEKNLTTKITWCNNYMTVRASPEIIEKLRAALEESRLMNTFARVRKGATESERVARWGTRWEIAAGDTEIMEDEEKKKKSVHTEGYLDAKHRSAEELRVSFLSVDAPPLAFFNTLCATEGVEGVSAYYIDFSTPRAGTWVDGEETDFSNDPSSEKAPRDFWSIMDCMNEYPGRK